MTAIQAMKAEIARIDCILTELCDESGFIKSSMRYKYQMLVEEKTHLKRAVDWMEALYNPIIEGEENDKRIERSRNA